MESFDYVIVGAGTAGCVLADRLSASGRHRVLVLEAGGSDARFWIKAPIGYGFTFADPAVNWKYQTAASPGLDGRSMYWPRGRVVGGSSSINALVYCRGMPADFDDWRALGNTGWSWDEVRPYFERTERRVSPDGRASTDGALDVKDVTPFLHPMREQWLAAAAELGLPVTDDFNGSAPEGFGCYQVSIRDGRRWSAADAFLRPALRRSTVKLQTGAWVRKLRCEGRRITGVEYVRGGVTAFARADREVIVCGGAVNSPQLLQLSGIGPGAVLAAHGIAPVLDNPAVGGNLQDHLAVVYSFKATRPTLNDELGSPLGQALAGARYLLTRRGPLSLSVNQFGGFVRARPGAARPDVQLYFNPVTYGAGDATRKRIKLDAFSGFYLCFQPTRPTSTGRIDLASGDFRDAPRISPNYLSTDQDVEDARFGGRLMQAIARTRAIAGLIREPIAPDLLRMGEADLVADFRARAATVYHPVGTCRMGRGIGESVVDAALRVHGVERLRVVDASVFPTVTSANTNAPTLMVAQKGADIILAGT
ncbi:MAG: GMC family oxidoreductase N-terminal domain-containing protein [Steroidobacteraceae bacterium]